MSCLSFWDSGVSVNGVCVVQVREFWPLLVLHWDFEIRHHCLQVSRFKDPWGPRLAMNCPPRQTIPGRVWPLLRQEGPSCSFPECKQSSASFRKHPLAAMRHGAEEERQRQGPDEEFLDLPSLKPWHT